MRGNSGHHFGQGDRPYDPMERLHVVAHYSPLPRRWILKNEAARA
jgi:hypothetical protein